MNHETEHSILLEALLKIAELEGDCENQQFKLTRFQASQIARAAIAKVDLAVIRAAIDETTQQPKGE